jgi:hypothetical protein
VGDDVAKAVGGAFALGGNSVHPDASESSAEITTARYNFPLTA